MDKKQIVIAVIVIGVVIALVGILADTIGLGGDNNFGGRQMLMTAVGIVVILAGVGLHFYGDKFFNQDGGEDKSTE
jgi:hypothetical protein